MDFEFKMKLASERIKVEDMFEYEGKIGRGKLMDSNLSRSNCETNTYTILQVPMDMFIRPKERTGKQQRSFLSSKVQIIYL